MAKETTKTEEHAQRSGGFALGRLNYILLLIGLGIIGIGLLLLMGGGSPDPSEFNPAIFNARRLTVAPIVLLLGFFFEIFAIMYRPKGRR